MRTKQFFLFALLIVLNTGLYSQTCDCDLFPIKKECKKVCGIKLLQKGSKQQLKNNLKLNDETAQKIIDVPNRSEKTKVEDFKKVLPNKYYIQLQKHFNTWNNYTTENGDIVMGDKPVTTINNYYPPNDDKSEVSKRNNNPLGKPSEVKAATPLLSEQDKQKLLDQFEEIKIRKNIRPERNNFIYLTLTKTSNGSKIYKEVEKLLTQPGIRVITTSLYPIYETDGIEFTMLSGHVRVVIGTIDLENLKISSNY